MRKYILTISVVVLVACGDKNDIVTNYYSNGNPKEIIYKTKSQVDSSVHYFENIKFGIKAIKYWKNNEVNYQKDFFDNGELMREGSLLRDGFRICKWSLYSPTNYKYEVIEYFNIRGESYINQSWKLNKNGDTLSGGNHFTLIRKKDTVTINEPNRFHFFLDQKALNNSELVVCVPKLGTYVKSDFSNESDVAWDTINNMARSFKNHPTYRDWKYDVLFEIIPTKIGNDTLKGFLLEKEVLSGNDSIDFITRKIYFKIPYFVK